MIPPTFIDSIEETLQQATDAPPEPEAGTPLHERLSVFVRLDKLLRDLEDATKQVKATMARMEPDLATDMARAGCDQMRIHGMTVHFRTETWVRKLPEKDGVTVEMVCDALRAIGRADMVADNYSPSSLKSLVKEYTDNGEPVPEPLAKVLDVGSKTVLSVLKVK